ncbi:hypothetical protein WJX73_007084 [Symbiochloris irregularis]|uniref:Dihydroorotate dehydrogenase (quinone), mitochondrial n=1 Tax=Symbiochloris irregularis TaxID=706552 RepID=A0AAW1NM04_9CHLO
MKLGTVAKRVGALFGVASAGVVWTYRDDPVQFRFDAATWETRPFPESLLSTVWNRTFPNPIGLAAGFDKDAEGVEGLLCMGFGFVEIGSVTPLPQPGNAKPRVFRLPELNAVINRYGFNSSGVDEVGKNLQNFRTRAAQDPARAPGLLGVNLGKNKTSDDAAADYCLGAAKLGRHADYLVINVSSPNTPGLRALQSRKQLELIIKRMRSTRDSMSWGVLGPPPILVKVAPDLPDVDRRDVAAVALRSGIDGLIVSNTTMHRPQLVADHPCGHETGGLSGEPLRQEALAALKEMYRLTKGKLPIIGCGGISTGQHAYESIRAGASLVQLYTGIAYGGPALVPRLKRELAACLEADGFQSVGAAVGADHR